MQKNLKRISQLVTDSKGSLTHGQVRFWVHDAANNGLAAAGAIVRIGRAVFIDIDALDRWFESKTMKAVA